MRRYRRKFRKRCRHYSARRHINKSIKAGGIKEYANMRMKRKRVFRRNQIIITTLAIMIAAGGVSQLCGKIRSAGGGYI